MAPKLVSSLLPQSPLVRPQYHKYSDDGNTWVRSRFSSAQNPPMSPTSLSTKAKFRQRSTKVMHESDLPSALPPPIPRSLSSAPTFHPWPSTSSHTCLLETRSKQASRQALSSCCPLSWEHAAFRCSRAPLDGTQISAAQRGHPWLPGFKLPSPHSTKSPFPAWIFSLTCVLGTILYILLTYLLHFLVLLPEGKLQEGEHFLVGCLQLCPTVPRI